MELNLIRAQAEINLQALSSNSYPGRGFVIGLDAMGKNYVQAYWLTGRSENSRNRVLEADGGVVRTAVADEQLPYNPELTIYTAMDEAQSSYVVSNGRQTDTAIDRLRGGRSLWDAMLDWSYENDRPHYTPRITGALLLNGSLAEVQIFTHLRSVIGSGCERMLYSYEDLPIGIGYCVTTYRGDEEPLPAFTGKPYLLPLGANIETTAAMLWGTLNEDKRVALVVKAIDKVSGHSTVKIINKHERVPVS